MAPRQKETSGRSNKIRFVLVEADISDGNLSELTQAITSALKPSPAPMRQITRSAQPALTASQNGAGEAHLDELAEVLDAETQEPEETEEPDPEKVRKFKPPEYLPELLAGDKGKEFKEFATLKAPRSKNRKYLVATYWLREHGGSPAVNANKIYTCFKTAGWSVGFKDWNQTFRNLVHSEHLRKESGEFAINPLGEDVVLKGTD